jgi:hypothetical protein
MKPLSGGTRTRAGAGGAARGKGRRRKGDMQRPGHSRPAALGQGGRMSSDMETGRRLTPAPAGPPGENARSCVPPAPRNRRSAVRCSRPPLATTRNAVIMPQDLPRAKAGNADCRSDPLLSGSGPAHEHRARERGLRRRLCHGLTTDRRAPRPQEGDGAPARTGSKRSPAPRAASGVAGEGPHRGWDGRRPPKARAGGPGSRGSPGEAPERWRPTPSSAIPAGLEVPPRVDASGMVGRSRNRPRLNMPEAGLASRQRSPRAIAAPRNVT